MINNTILYSLDDVMIEPADITTVRHRANIKTTYDDGFLPIFTSPMPCVVQYEDGTFLKYFNSNINPIIPRTTPLEDRMKFFKPNTLLSSYNIFVAFSLDEFIDLFVNNTFDYGRKGTTFNVLVDIACGSMEILHKSIKKAKEIYEDDIRIMSGNIASPSEFLALARSGCDMIRCSVGTGSGCCTATYTGIYYPMASLIDDCFNLRHQYGLTNKVKIIADGGITTYRNAFKALALGADYVMMGSRLCQCSDSAGEIEITHYAKPPQKIYYGMASEYGSSLLGKKTEAPEGKIVKYPVMESISEFSKLFSRYLKSTMSYCNAHYLEQFIGKQTLNVISNNAAKQFNQ